MPNLEEVKNYSPARLTQGKEWFISFYAFDPATAKRKRKKIKVNHIKSIKERRRYAQDLIIRINNRLAEGWNPWIEADSGRAYATLDEVVESYRIFMDKMLHDDNYRAETHKTYISSLQQLISFNDAQKAPITYIYQLDKGFIIRFLDEIYLGRDTSPYTRDKYLAWCKTFFTWLVQRDYIKTSPIEGLKFISNRHKVKKRTIIPPREMGKLNEYLETKNKHYLLACYLIYYCFIRPKELSMLKLENFCLSDQTVFIPDTVSKNRKDGTVTLPKKVIMLMVELDIFSYADGDYLFSKDFKPGEKYRSGKSFRDFWAKYVRKDLKFKSEYVFYSLKDTGITNMLRSKDALSVRDQARHSSLIMTNTYTPHDIQQANALIMDYEDDF